MQAGLSISQKVLRLFLMLIVAVALAMTAFSVFPANGVRSDVIVLFSKQPDGLYARDITANALIIAQSTLRERKVEGRQVQESYRNLANNSSGGTTFSVNTYGQDEPQNLARENRTALNEILLAVRKHYGSSFPVFFDVVGNTYETARWRHVFVIGIISLLLSVYIVSNLFAAFASKAAKDEVKEEDQDFNEWYKDKNVLEQINSYESIAQKNENNQETVQSQARKSFEQQKKIEQRISAGEGAVWAPQSQTIAQREHTQDGELQADIPDTQEAQTHEADQERTPLAKKASRKEPSRLAEKWGKGSAADRLKALETTTPEREEEVQGVQKVQKAQEMFSLTALSATDKKEHTKNESENVPQENILAERERNAFSLPHHRMSANQNSSELDETIVETVPDIINTQEQVSKGSKDQSQEQEKETEKFFEPGGRLSGNPENKGVASNPSTTVNAPGNLPIVDVTQFTNQPSEHLAQSSQGSDNNADTQQETDNIQIEEVVTENDVDFTSEDSQFLADSEQEVLNNQTEGLVDPEIKIGEPTSEDLKKRLNKLLRGEL